MKNLKKFSQKDRYGNMISFEFEVPPMENQVPKFEDYFNHPGQPQGTDTVPAWLTPGERVMNAEAERMYGPVLAQMNDDGRAIQAAQGGTIPNYGPEPEYAAGGCKVKYAAKGSKASCDCPECSRTVYAAEGDWITGNLLDQLRQVESGGDPNAVSPMGAIGPYQLMPATIADPGYGVQVPENFDPTNEAQSRAFAESYLRGIQAQYPDYTPQEVLAAYNAGPGRVAQYKAGEIPQLPQETQDYIGKFDIAMSAPDAPIVDAQGNVYPIDTLSASTAPPVPQSGPEIPQEEEQGFFSYLDNLLGDSPERRQARKDKLNFRGDALEIKKGKLEEEKAIAKGQETRTGATIVPRSIEEIDKEIAEVEEQINQQTSGLAAGMDGPQEKDLQVSSPKEVEASEGAIKPPKIKDVMASIRESYEDGDDADGQDTALLNSGKGYLAALGDKAQEALSTGFNWLKDTVGKSGLLDEEALTRSAILYLGSRALGYDHEGSGNFAVKNYLTRVESNAKTRKAAKAKLEERAFELVKEGKLTPEEAAIYQITGSLQGLDIGPDKSDRKYSTYFKIGSGNNPQLIEGWVNKDGKYVYEDADGNEVEFNKAAYEEYKSDIFSWPELSGTLNKRLVDRFKDNVIGTRISDDETSTSTKVQKFRIEDLVDSYGSHLNKTYGPKGYLFLATPEGQRRMSSMVEKAMDYYDQTNEPIRNTEGFIRLIESDLYTIQEGQVLPNGKPINIKATDETVLQPLQNYVTERRKAGTNITTGTVSRDVLNLYSQKNLDDLKEYINNNPSYNLSEDQIEDIHKLKMEYKTNIVDKGKVPNGVHPNIYFIRYYVDSLNK